MAEIFFASGSKGKNVRADGLGGHMQRGYYVDDDSAVTHGPFVKKRDAIACLKAGSQDGLDKFREIGRSNASAAIDQRGSRDHENDDQCFGSYWDNMNDTLVESPGWNQLTENQKCLAFTAADRAFHSHLKANGIGWSC